MTAIADFHRLTCLRFVPYNGQTDYVAITKDNTGCWSNVGRTGNVYFIYLIVLIITVVKLYNYALISHYDRKLADLSFFMNKFSIVTLQLCINFTLRKKVRGLVFFYAFILHCRRKSPLTFFMNPFL